VLRNVLAAALLLLSSCDVRSPEEDGFLAKSPDDRVSYLRSQPIERQIDLYLFGMKRITPRPVALAAAIAEGGAVNAIIVSHRIRQSSDIMDRINLLYILIFMKNSRILDGCRIEYIRNSIMPEAYGVDEPLEHLRYALGVIELCVRPAQD
jgi:hypothetical protein